MFSPNLNKLILHVDSSQRISGTTTDFQICPNLSSYINQVKSCQLLSLEIVNTFYSVPLTKNNFKLRMVNVRNVGVSVSEFKAPISFLVDVTLPSKNYTADTLLSTLQTYVNNWFAINQNIFGVSDPIQFSVDKDAYKFSISVNPNINNYSLWGFIVPSSTLASLLGFQNLQPDSSLMNISSSNNKLDAILCSNRIGQTGPYINNLYIDDSNKYLIFSVKKNTSEYGYSCVIPPDTYTINNLVSVVNSQIQQQDTTFKSLTSFPTVINQKTIYEALPSTGSIKLVFYNNQFVFCNATDSVPGTLGSGALTFKFLIQFSKNFLNTIGGFADAVFSGFVNLAYSNIVANQLGSYTVNIPVGYYSANSLYDTLNTIFQVMFGQSGVSYDLSTKRITSTLGNIAFMNTSTAASLLSLTTVASNNLFVSNSAISSSIPATINVPSLSLYQVSTATSVINLRGADVIYLYSSLPQSTSCDGRGNNSRILAKIPLTSAIGYTTIWTNQSGIDFWRFPTSSDIPSIISFSIRDKDGNVLENQNLDWSMTIVLYFDS